MIITIDVVVLVKAIIQILIVLPLVYFAAGCLYYIWDTKIATLLDPIDCEDDNRESDFLEDVKAGSWNM